ncbi:MAG TPA: type II toxin-antitoxin system HigB family toxin [Thermoguttaceae bacterium]|nr:type II toxin-antitoxin system HigB family toxin [Thermoguttaceae bacterium]
MHVISEKKLREFWQQWPDAETPLRAWCRVAEHATWETFADVRETYPRADQVGRCTVFNIGGNKFRLVVMIFYEYGRVYIRHVLTHEEYDKGTWKGEC